MTERISTHSEHAHESYTAKHRKHVGAVRVLGILPKREHTHGRGHPEQDKKESKQIISRRWQVATVAGNAIIGAAELVTSGSSTLSVLADGVHNAGDAGTYYMQTENILNPKLSEKQVARRRKIAHAIIAGLSMGVAAKAGYDLTLDNETAHNPTTLYAAGASLTLNALLMATLYRGIFRKKREGTLGPHERDLTKHLWAVDIPSAGIATAGALLQRHGLDDVESAAAVASGLLGAYAFRPTSKNLNHSNCAKHGDHSAHGHGHDDHRTGDLVGRHDSGEVKESEKKEYVGRHRKKEANLADVLPLASRINKRKRRTRVIAATALVAALSAGAVGSGKFSNVFESQTTAENNASSHVSPAPQNDGSIIFELPSPIQESVSPPESNPTVVFEQVQRGDTQWNMVEDAIDATGHASSSALVNVLTDLTAYTNQEISPNPDMLTVGQTVQVPSAQVIDLVAMSLNDTSSDPSFSENIQELQETEEMPKEQKIKKKESLLKKLKAHITYKLRFS